MTAYTKVHDPWEDLPSTNTPIDAAALDQIEAGIAEAQDDADSALGSIGDHIADTSAAHAASAVSFSPVGTVGATNVQSAVAEVASDAAALVTDHTGDSAGAHAASAISFTPTGSVSSSNVQAAIAEVAAEIAGGTGTVDSVVAGNGIDVDATDTGNPIVAVEAAITDKLDGIEALADVTDATNVAAAGAVMEADTTTAAMSFVVDEDNMASNSATKVPTQQSVKAYVDGVTGGFLLVDADRASRSSGSITLNSSTWADLDTGLDLTLSGVQAGDIVRCGVSGMHNATGATNNYLDVATIVSAAPVTYLSGGAGSATSRGVVAWSGEASTATAFGGVAEMALVSGDIDAGSLLLRLRYRQSSAVARTLFATADIRFHWWAEVYRPN